MNKIILFTLFAALSFGLASAQTPEQDMARADRISKDQSYRYGHGYGDSEAEAREAALQDFLSKIQVQVESTVDQINEESFVNGVAESSTVMKSIVNTYSQATLHNTESIKVPPHGKVKLHYCMLFMKEDELDRMYKERQDRVENYVRDALQAEEKGRVDNALKYFNYAYVLLHSLQYPASIKMTVEDEEKLLLNWIPQRMEEILDNVSVGVAALNKEDNTVDLTFSYKGAPVAGLDFSYNNGLLDSHNNSANNGIAQISFPPNYPLQSVTIRVETRFADASNIDKELQCMINQFPPRSFPNAAKIVGTEGKALKAEKAATKEFNAVATAEKHNGLASVQGKDYKEYKAIIDEVLKSIKNKSFAPNPALFTEDGLKMFDKLLKYGSATILGTPDPGFFPYGERVVARSVPMKFSFKNNKRSFTEEVTFTFTPDKKIEAVAFGLGKAARDDIFAQGGDAWTDEARITIATFLENYKTAFALENYEYINSIFDEDAYIIVGHKLQKLGKAQQGDFTGLSQTDEYELVRKSKGEYMAQLKKCFDSNEFININFANNDVLKAAEGGEAYGIQIKQDYYSDNYGDQGYLYLFVDMNDPEKPIIKIRTWQPERNPGLTPHMSKSNPNYGIYGNHSFE